MIGSLNVLTLLIEQNKKYYYIARGIDYHQNRSNPTPIYEVEIINDNGLIIPNINLFDFEKDDQAYVLEKEIKRYLKIRYFRLYKW